MDKIPDVTNGYYYQVNQDQPENIPIMRRDYIIFRSRVPCLLLNNLFQVAVKKYWIYVLHQEEKQPKLAGTNEQNGLIIANEIHPKRAKVLSENIERLGITNTIVTNENPERLAERFKGYFDKILVDAPVPGRACFAKMRKPYSTGTSKKYSPSKLQKNILEAAYHMLKTGGDHCLFHLYLLTRRK